MVVRWSLVERGSERTALRTRWRKREKEQVLWGPQNPPALLCFVGPSLPSSLALPTKTVQGTAAGRHLTGSNSKTPFYVYLRNSNVDGRGRGALSGVTLDLSVAGNSATIRRRRRHMPITEVLNARLSLFSVSSFFSHALGWMDGSSPSISSLISAHDASYKLQCPRPSTR